MDAPTRLEEASLQHGRVPARHVQRVRLKSEDGLRGVQALQDNGHTGTALLLLLLLLQLLLLLLLLPTLLRAQLHRCTQVHNSAACLHALHPSPAQCTRLTLFCSCY